MVAQKEGEDEKLVYGLRLSSVVPARTTGDNKCHELSDMDLAMKLHYLKGLYFFNNNNNNNNNKSSGGSITISELKKPMFDWLIPYFIVCGRIRTTSEEAAGEGGGRPVIKLNDAGIRIVEAHSSKTVDEWLAMEGFLGLGQDQLVYSHALGPDLGFTPLVFIQVTWFKCGGYSIGLNWAHVLGDIFSATTFMNKLGQYMQGHHNMAQILSLPDPSKPKYLSSNPTREPRSLKRVDPVGDHWVATPNCKMGTHSFNLTSTQLTQLLSKVHGPKIYDPKKMSNQCFEIISAIMWKSIAKIRKYSDPKLVTICRPKCANREEMNPYNGQVVGTIEVNSSVSSMDLPGLVSLIAKNVVNEVHEVEELVRKDNGSCDVVVYGANLTFVNMEEANLYGFKSKGQSPILASYTIGGVGEEGVVLVMPGAKDGENDGKLVVVILPEEEGEGLKRELRAQEWFVV